MKSLLILLALAFAQVSCSSIQNADSDSVYVRIQNASDIDLTSVTVQFPGEEGNLGSVESGQYSDYHPFDVAYRYGRIEAKSGDESYQLVPFDYVGEQPLESGHYTFQLNIENGQLSLTFLRD